MSTHYSFDTENGAQFLGRYRCKGDMDGRWFDAGEELETRVITYAPIGCRSLNESAIVIARPGENVYDKWFNKFISETGELSFVFHVWNLAWEWRPIMDWVKSLPACDYEYDKDRDSTYTSNGAYRLTVRVKNRVLTFVDDNNHYHTSVKEATASLKADPKYKKIMKDAGVEGKESDLVEKFHEIWYAYGPFSEEWLTYTHYARVDAFCQALCCEHLFDAGRFCSPKCFNGKHIRADWADSVALSASGAGFREAKSLLIYGCHYRDIPQHFKDDLDYRSRGDDEKWDEQCAELMGRRLDQLWNQHFGTPSREERLLIENNLRGGLVFGVCGVHKGVFYHYDYKSSYPYEYAYCKLPVMTGLRDKYDSDGKLVVDKNGKPKKVKGSL